ncbi:MAG: hypothetical protein WB660_23190 [Candidatus Sulfotelmatobacter sp.]
MRTNEDRVVAAVALSGTIPLTSPEVTDYSIRRQPVAGLISEKDIFPLLRKQKGFKDEITFSGPGGIDVTAISLTTNPPFPRPAERIRALASNRPWHPTQPAHYQPSAV